MSWLTVNQATASFLFGESILSSVVCMPALIDLLREAFELDGHNVSVEHIWDEIIRPPMTYTKSSNASVEGDERFQMPSAVYMNYADWATNIGKVFGTDPDADIQPNWRKSNPHTNIVVKALADVAARMSIGIDDAYKALNGHSMAEVFVRSMETGEDFDQSRARLAMERRGLHTVQ